MASGREVYERWLRRTPTEAPLAEVDAVLEEFFPGWTRPGGKEPRIVDHPWLKALTAYRATGNFSVPLKQGRTVKPVYIRRIVHAVRFVEWIREHLPEWPESMALPPVVGERYEAEHGG